MQTLWKYQPEGDFTNKNAGFSMWCFGEYEGKSYFIKQFLSPKYPENDTVSSPQKIEKRIAECRKFEEQKIRLYRALARYSDGNDVRIMEFFRVGTRYYMVTEKVDALPWTVQTVASLPEGEKRRLCAVISHSIASLHDGHIIHSDIKHDNILFTDTGLSVTAKVIDFDGGFLDSDVPSLDEGITGDAVYFSPEVCVRSYGEERALTCKLDVFAMGILFHQYFAGCLPGFDRNEFSCVGEAVLNGETPVLDPSLPQDISQLIGLMLAEDPERRPTAREVFRVLRPGAPAEPLRSAPPAADPIKKGVNTAAVSVVHPPVKPYVPEDAGAGAGFCSMCGNERKKGEAFCYYCGNRFPDDEISASVKRKAGFYRPEDDL